MCQLTTSQQIIIVFIILAVIVYLVNKLNPSNQYEWFSQNFIPENPREDRYISEDVLVYDYDTKKHIIGYYSYSNDKWCFINNQEAPSNFCWRYLEIEIEQP